MTTALDAIGEKVALGQALGADEARAIWDSRDLVSVGMLADAVRRRLHGDLTTYLRVASVHVRDAAGTDLSPAAGEVRLAGSAADLLAHVSDVRALVERAGRVPVSAGALDDLEAESTQRPPLAEVLGRLRDAGVWGIAEARLDRLVSPESAVRAALDTGLCVARFTVGRPPPEGPWDLLERVQRLQAATGAVRVFAPLARQEGDAGPSTGYADIKLVALARLLLARVTSIQVDWSQHGPKLAQVALLFGADDLDGVSPLESAETGPRRAPAAEVRRNITAASLTPVERDGRFVSRET